MPKKVNIEEIMDKKRKELDLLEDLLNKNEAFKMEEFFDTKDNKSGEGTIGDIEFFKNLEGNLEHVFYGTNPIFGRDVDGAIESLKRFKKLLCNYFERANNLIEIVKLTKICEREDCLAPKFSEWKRVKDIEWRDKGFYSDRYCTHCNKQGHSLTTCIEWKKYLKKIREVE